MRPSGSPSPLRSRRHPRDTRDRKRAPRRRNVGCRPLRDRQKPGVRRPDDSRGATARVAWNRPIAASEHVSAEEYRIPVASTEAAVVVRHVGGEEWMLGSAACTPRLTAEHDLHVGARSSNVLGRVTTSTLRRQPAVGGAQKPEGVIGGLLVVAGVTRCWPSCPIVSPPDTGPCRYPGSGASDRLAVGPVRRTGWFRRLPAQ